MKKFLEFLKRLIFNYEPIPSVQDMEYISSELKDGEETIIHGKGKWWIKLTISKDLDKQEGQGRITSNLPRQISEEDVVYLLKKYL